MAPVNRTPKEAAEGRLNVLVGGDAEAIDVVRPLFSTYAETVHHLGDLGSGYRAKLIHNFIAQANAAVLAEAFGTATKARMNLSEFAQVCRLSGAHSKTFDRIIPFLLKGDDSGQQFALRNAAKDMRSYAQLAAAQSSTAIVAEAVRQIYLLANPMLHEPLKIEHIKHRLLGHWGTTPGLNFIYVHMNRLICNLDLNAIYIAGPGHGGPHRGCR